MRNFARAPVQYIREEQDGSLTGREQLKDGEEGERNAFASAYAGFSVLCCLSQPGVRIGLKPDRLGRSWCNGGEWIHGRRGRCRQCSWWAFLDRVEAGIGGDAIEPGAKGRVALEGVKVLPGTEHGLLHEIFRLLQRPQ